MSRVPAASHSERRGAWQFAIESPRGALLVLLLLASDIATSIVSVSLAYFVRFEGAIPDPFRFFTLPAILVVASFVPVVFALAGLYNYVWRQVGVDMVVRVALAVACCATIALLVDLGVSEAVGHRAVPFGVVLMGSTFLFLGAVASRTLSRLARYFRARSASVGGRPVLIVGAGDAGSLLLRDIEVQPGLDIQVVGILDDDPSKRGRILRNTRVLGPIGDVSRYAAELGVQEILIAMPGVGRSKLAVILDLCADAGVPVRVIPGLASGAHVVGVRDLRAVGIRDLLGREPAPTDVTQIRQTIEGRTVLVTGAAGSIGSELCRQLFSVGPAKVMLVDVDESRLYELFLELDEIAPGRVEMRICDIRDDRKLHEIFADCCPDVVIHAAAYKHVPLMEIEPDEAVKTNVVGTWNVVEACLRTNVSRFVLISTDKAVAPKSVMGMTKAIAERIAMSASQRGLNATAVRFGNVLGSRGSVIPLFEEQLRRGGALKVTHPDVTRYFMTIPEAARLVLQAQALSASGDIFVLEMGQPVRIVDLAEKMIALSGSDSCIEFTGLRPAEKLHEVLTNAGEDLIPTSAERVSRLNALPVPPADLSEMVHAMATAARLNDRMLLKATFKLLLPQFDGIASTALGFIDEKESSAAISVIDPDMDTLL